MRNYNLEWNEKLRNIILSYDECRKVYIDQPDKIRLLLKENISNDDYHIYTYSNEVKFLIKAIKLQNNKINHMVVYLLSNDLDKIDSIYFKIRDEVHSSIDCLSYVYNHQKDNYFKYFIDDRIGIIKNFEICMKHEKLMLSDLENLNHITKLELKNGYYYLGTNKYLNVEEYEKIFNEKWDKELYVALRHIGPYRTIYKTYDKLLKLIRDEEKEIVGLPMEQFVCGRWNEKDENKYVTNIMIPIKKISS